MRAPITIGVSLKAYLSYAETVSWLEHVAGFAATHPGLGSGDVELFVAPSAPALEAAARILRGTPVAIAAQDVSQWDGGAFTGETGASLLAEIGVTIAEIGHAERRTLLHETDEIIRRKADSARSRAITPLLCVGEAERGDPAENARLCAGQIRSSGPGALMIAYEPLWAIGAAAPAPTEYVRATIDAIRAELPEREITVLYGGSAGPGLLAGLRPDADGLFLGRFAHDPLNLLAVLDEASSMKHESNSLHPVGAWKTD